MRYPGNPVQNGQSNAALWTPAEVQASKYAPACLRVVVEWISTYVVRPHPQLGRNGIVCPFVPPALRLNTLWLAAVSGGLPSQEEVCRVLRHYLEVYNGLATSSAHQELKTLVLVFEDMENDAAPTLIGEVHEIMKPTFVHAGLMLGEFFSLNESPGLHNPDFRPLRSPIPLFVYRQMVPDDLVFLTKPLDPPDLRARFVSDYLRTMGDALSPARRREATGALTTALREMAGPCKHGRRGE